MTKARTLLVLSALIAGMGLLISSEDASAAFHIMRVYGVMGGASGNTNIQYVELRMADPGQNLVATHDICFFDASGAPYARFTFPSNTGNGADEASILVGASEFDSAWAAGSPDFTFSAANTTAIAGGADVSHPIRSPSGKVSFGSDLATTPAQMCGAMFSVIDSVAYGASYGGAVDFGTRFGSDLPTAGIQNLKVQGPAPTNPANGSLCSPGSIASNCSALRNNSVDYAVVNTNDAGNQPRNAANQSGPVAVNDADGDGVADASDLCPGTASGAAVDSNGCSQAQVDGDADGACDPSAPSGGPGPCSGTDNCPTTANPGQGNVDGDSLGDACDPDADNDGFDNTAESGAPLCSNAINDDDMNDSIVNDGCPAVGAAESVCSGATDDDGDGFVNDGCAQSGSFSEGQFNIGTNQLGPCNTGMGPDPSPSWPIDFVSGGVPESTDKITLGDLTSFLAPTRYLDKSPGMIGFDDRWDLVPGATVMGSPWIQLNDLTAMLAGTTGIPPMFGGATKAFNGPACTGP